MTSFRWILSFANEHGLTMDVTPHTRNALPHTQHTPPHTHRSASPMPSSCPSSSTALRESKSMDFSQPLAWQRGPAARVPYCLPMGPCPWGRGPDSGWRMALGGKGVPGRLGKDEETDC